MIEVVGIGAAVFDTLITVDDYPIEDTKQRANDMVFCGGGPTATALVTSSKLGTNCSYIGVLSKDSGGLFLLNDFIKYGVNTTHIATMEGYRSFTSYILLNKQSASRTIVFDKGNLPSLKLSNAQKQAISDAKLMLVDGNDVNAAVEAAKIARQNDTIVLYDAGGLYDGVERLLALTDILIPSQEFALMHTGETDVRKAAAVLASWYNPYVVVITCGEKGGLLYENDEYIVYPAYPADVVDSNGAGDVFHGAFATAMVRGFSYEQACHFSSGVSALKCTGVGARESVPTYEKTIEYLRRNGYEL